MAISKRFNQVELLARKAIEIIEKLKETGLMIQFLFIIYVICIPDDDDYYDSYNYNLRDRRSRRL